MRLWPRSFVAVTLLVGLAAAEQRAAAEAHPDVSLHSLPVCEQRLLCLSQALSDPAQTKSSDGERPKAADAALLRIGQGLAHTPPAERARVLDCLRHEVRLSAPLPDGSAVVVSTVPNLCGRDKEHQPVTPCAVMVQAPSALSSAALFLRAPTSFNPTQQLAVISESYAVELIDLWNIHALSRRHEFGRTLKLPDNCIYVAPFDNIDGSAAIYTAEGRLDLKVPIKSLIGRIRDRDLQLLGAFARFAEVEAGTQKATLRLFAGFQEVTVSSGQTEGAGPTQRTELPLRQRALAAQLEQSFSALSVLNMTPPRVELLTLQVDESDAGPGRYRVHPLTAYEAGRGLETNLALPAMDGWRWTLFLLWLLVAALLVGCCTWSGRRLWQNRRSLLEQQARDAAYPASRLVDNAIGRGDALLDALRLLPLLPLLILGGAAVRHAAHMATVLSALLALTAMCAVGLGLALHAQRRRKSGTASHLGEHYGQTGEELWQDLRRMSARSEPAALVWRTERRLRTVLTEELSLRRQLLRLGARRSVSPLILGAVLGALVLAVQLRPLSASDAATATAGRFAPRGKPTRLEEGAPTRSTLDSCLPPPPPASVVTNLGDAASPLGLGSPSDKRPSTPTQAAELPATPADVSTKTPTASPAMARRAPVVASSTRQTQPTAQPGYVPAPIPYLEARKGR